MSFDIVWVDKSLEEAHAYLNSPKSVVDTLLQAVSGGATDLINLAIYNLTDMEPVSYD